MFGMGAGELILILVLVLLVFGPKKLPDLAKGIGKALREFRRASTDLQAQVTGDNELGNAVREVQAAVSGMPSPEEVQATKRARELEEAPAPSDTATPALATAGAPEVAPRPAGDEPAATGATATAGAPEVAPRRTGGEPAATGATAAAPAALPSPEEAEPGPVTKP